jgi:hypothetical protein
VDDGEFTRRVVDMTIRKAVPVGLRAAARVNPKYAPALEAAAVRCEQEGTREACKAAQKAAAAAATAAAADDAAAAYAAYAVACDTSLAQYAEWVVEILIDMHAPGCQWLDLVPKEAA